MRSQYHIHLQMHKMTCLIQIISRSNSILYFSIKSKYTTVRHLKSNVCKLYAFKKKTEFGNLSENFVLQNGVNKMRKTSETTFKL